MAAKITSRTWNYRGALLVTTIAVMAGVWAGMAYFLRPGTEEPVGIGVPVARPSPPETEETTLPERRTRSALSPELLEMIRQVDRVDRRYDAQVLEDHLRDPKALAVHPQTGRMYALEAGTRVVALAAGRLPESVVDESTPVYRGIDETTVASHGVHHLSGMAFAVNGDLYVTEHVPGGRLILFPVDARGEYPQGRVMEVPGVDSRMAWTDVDVSPDGRILLVGLDEDPHEGIHHIRMHRSVMVYRDHRRDWWRPFQRLYADFSSVRFSISGQQALYTCRQTGEMGWVDLNNRRTLLGSGSQYVAAPSGVEILPDGTLVALDETGTILRLDPAEDRLAPLMEGLPSVSNLRWDRAAHRLLAIDRTTGQLLALVPDPAFGDERDRLQYAMYYPMYRIQNVPRECPEYLARILAFGGLDYLGTEEPPVTFREFVSRIPLIAADVRAVSMDPREAVPDPIEIVNFVVFEPNRMMWEEAPGLSLTFGLFVAKTESGRLIKSTTRPIRIYGDDESLEGSRVDRGTRPVTLPQPSAVSVSMRGIAAVQFLGMGYMADYALVLNTHQPDESYMMVYNRDGSIEQYRLQPYDRDPAESWVVAYAHQGLARWDRLSGLPGEELLLPLDDMPF